jgi:PelA/Pel-15E family pectate lyase
MHDTGVLNCQQEDLDMMQAIASPRRSAYALVCLLGVLSLPPACSPVEEPVQGARAEVDTPPSLSGFSDAVHHWQNRHGSDYPRYAPDQVREIADNLLLLQRDHGGWAQNQDPARILADDEGAKLMADAANPNGSFDNRNVYTQIAYLMEAFERLGDERYRDAALKGLNYLLSNQFETCGGWPHSLPKSGSYRDMITVADEVFSGPLTLLQDIAEQREPYASLDAATHARATQALKSGEDCLLQLQGRQGEKLAGWAGQYDPETLEPVQGRTFELPSIAAQETVYILYYLMSVENPSPEIVAAVDGGVTWLREVAIPGKRLEQYDLAEPVEFPYHTADYDRRLVDDRDAPPLWARFYDLQDNSVVLANRDSVRVEKYQDVSQERRTGYHWFGTWGQTLVETDHAAWRCRVVEKRQECPDYAERRERID